MLDAQIDGFLKTRDICALRKLGPRALHNHIKRGWFPPPDVPGRRGRASCWRVSTVRAALDEVQARATERDDALDELRERAAKSAPKHTPAQQSPVSTTRATSPTPRDGAT